MTNDDSAALRPYEEVLADARKKLNIHTPFSLKAGDWWHFDMSDNRERMTLTCPPFHDDNIPPFLHYLCHAKICEEGWMFPVTKTPQMKADDPFYFFTINRAADHFFDYYAWLLVNEVFGPTHALAFTRMVAEATPELIVQNLQWRAKQFGAKHPAYIMSLDWFVLFPAITASIDAQRTRQMRVLKKKLMPRRDFADATTPRIREKLITLTKFFRQLLRQYPRYDALLNDMQQFQSLYRAYYRTVFAGTAVRSKIVNFY